MDKKSESGRGHTRRDALKMFGMVGGSLALHGVMDGVPSLAWASEASGWQAADMPSLVGKRMLVTGGSSGMGFEDALALSRAGAQVIIAARNPQRGAESIERIRGVVPDARIRFEQLDLADLSSVRSLALRLNGEGEALDVLINNAAIMAPQQREVSRDGFEMQLATNFLGHFALTGLLLPSLRQSADARVVTLASIAVNRGRIDFADLQSERAYNPYATYAQSKLACLMMAFERSGAAWPMTGACAASPRIRESRSPSWWHAGQGWRASSVASGQRIGMSTTRRRRARCRRCSPRRPPKPRVAATTGRPAKTKSAGRWAWPGCRLRHRMPTMQRACGRWPNV